MLIREDRDKLAEMIRHLASKRMPMWSFCEKVENAGFHKSLDRDVRHIASECCSLIEDDLLEGESHDSLVPAVYQDQLAKNAMFLYSDETTHFVFNDRVGEFVHGVSFLSVILAIVWPFSLLIALFLNLLAGLVLAGYNLVTGSDYRYAPFDNRASFERAKAKPRLLVG